MLNEKGLENTVHPMLKYNLVHVWGAGLLLCSVLETCFQYEGLSFDQNAQQIKISSNVTIKTLKQYVTLVQGLRKR